MTKTKTYTAVYRSDDDGNWLVHIDGLEGCHSYGRTLKAARRHIREALAAWLDVDDDTSLPIDDAIDLGAVGEHVEQLRELRTQYAHFGAQVADQTRAVVEELIGEGISMRDAADLLHISHQRVAQLAGKKAGRTAAASIQGGKIVSVRRGGPGSASGSKRSTGD